MLLVRVGNKETKRQHRVDAVKTFGYVAVLYVTTLLSRRVVTYKKVTPPIVGRLECLTVFLPLQSSPFFTIADFWFSSSTVLMQ